MSTDLDLGSATRRTVDRRAGCFMINWYDSLCSDHSPQPDWYHVPLGPGRPACFAWVAKVTKLAPAGIVVLKLLIHINSIS